jgi:hypothetical protein
MATPKPGNPISMLDMRNEITRAGSGAIDMSTLRTLYGGSGAISFSDLQACEGFVISTANTAGTKGVYSSGWDVLGTGSISPSELSGFMQIATNSFISSILTQNDAGGPPNGTTTLLSFDNDANISTPANNSLITAGYTVADITRVVTANTARSINTPAAPTLASINYTMPQTGSINFLIKF